MHLARPWRWLLYALLSLVVVIAVCEAVGWPFLRAPLQQRLSASLGRPVEFGPDFKLRLIGSVRLTTDALRVASPPDAPALRDEAGAPRPFLDAAGISLAVPYSTVRTLLRGEENDRAPVVRSLRVQRLDLALARDAGGNANWRLGPPREPQDREPTLPEFGQLVVEQGRLRLDDAKAQLQLDAKLSTREGTGSSGAGGLEVAATGRYRGAPLEGRLTSSGLLPLASSGADAPSVPLKLQVQAGELRAQLDGRVADLLNLASLDAELQASGPSLAAVGTALGATLPRTEAFEVRGRVRKAGAVWSAAIAQLRVGSSRLTGDLAYDPSAKPPRLSGELGGSRLALSDLAPAVGAPRAEEPDPAPNRLLPQREFSLPALDRMQADLRVDLKEVDLGTTELASFQPLGGRLRLHDRVLSLDDLRAETAGGLMRGKLVLDARAAQPRWDADLRFSGVRLEQFVRTRKPRAEPASKAALLSGTLGGQARLQGRGRSTAALLGSLDGSVELWVREGRMSSLLVEAIGLDLAESLGVIIAGDDGLPLRCAVARLPVHNGIVLTEVAVIDTPDSTLLLSGQVSLPQERLALKVTARPHDMSMLAVRAPVHITGRFVDPKVGVEAGKVGLRAAAAVALASAVGPLAGLLALTDLGEPERAVCGQALSHLRSPAAPERASRAKDAK